MFAVFFFFYKQYIAEVNEMICVNKIESKVKNILTFDKVLVSDNIVGDPYINGAKVVCEVIKHGKLKKIDVIKHLPQKHHNRKYGHRQTYTKLLIKEIVIQ